MSTFTPTVPPITVPWPSDPSNTSPSLPAWAGNTAYLAGAIVESPNGSTIRRIANGTSRATYDATEAAGWVTVGIGLADGNAAYPARAGGSSGTAAAIPFFNVKDYGAKGDGTTDDATAIQAAITAAAAASGEVRVPGGATYLVGSPLAIPSGITLRGPKSSHDPSNAGAAILKSSGNFAVIANADQVNGNFNVLIEDIALFGATGNTADIIQWKSSGARSTGIRLHRVYVDGYSNNGINWQNVGESEISKCWVEVAGNNALSLDSNCSDITVEGNQLFAHSAGANVGSVSLLVQGPNNILRGNFCWESPQFGIQLTGANAGGNIVTANRCNTNGKAGISVDTGAHDNVVSANVLYDNGPSGAACGINLDGGTTTNNIITNNRCRDAGSGNQIFGINLSTTVTGCYVVNNDVTGNTFLGVNNRGTGNTIRGNRGYNPVGSLSAQPTVPASGVVHTNDSQVDCTVFVAGGTVTAIAISGTTTGLTSGAFRVPAGSTITLTYSVAPTWQWFGD